MTGTIFKEDRLLHNIKQKKLRFLLIYLFNKKSTFNDNHDHWYCIIMSRVHRWKHINNIKMFTTARTKVLKSYDKMQQWREMYAWDLLHVM